MIDGFIALYIFMLAAFTGYEIIGKVPAILHTPLMSGSNFIHGIVLVGAMVAMGRAETTLEIDDTRPAGSAHYQCGSGCEHEAWRGYRRSGRRDRRQL